MHPKLRRRQQRVAMDSGAIFGGGLLCCCLFAFSLPVIIWLAGWQQLAPTEMALQYNWIWKTLSTDVVLQPGFQHVGYTIQLVKYPKTIQTITYDKIDGRTKDGLPIDMTGLTFQYKLIPGELYELYTQYEKSYGDYRRMYKLMGIHLITEMATNYTAYQFFNDKQKIATDMLYNMNRYYTKYLHGSVQSLQINDDHLPAAFQEMILSSATIKQNIAKTQKTLDARVVQMETSVKVAEAQANVTIQNARGKSSAIEQNGAADAAVITSFVQSELESYSEIKNSLGLKGNELLKYIWYDAVGGGSVIQPGKDFTVFSGVKPGAYMTAK